MPHLWFSSSQAFSRYSFCTSNPILASTQTVLTVAQEKRWCETAIQGRLETRSMGRRHHPNMKMGYGQRQCGFTLDTCFSSGSLDSRDAPGREYPIQPTPNESISQKVYVSQGSISRRGSLYSIKNQFMAQERQHGKTLFVKVSNKLWDFFPTKNWRFRNINKEGYVKKLKNYLTQTKIMSFPGGISGKESPLPR